MDTSETPRPNHELARFTGTSPAIRAPLPPATRNATGGGAPISARLVLRGLARHWWQALALWIVGTAALAALVYFNYKPVYRSFSLLRVEPHQADPFALRPDADLESYLQTQVQLITSPSVLTTVMHDPKVAGLSSIRNAQDVEQELREMIEVEIRPRSYLIEIAVESSVPAEAATIVDTVVAAFLEMDAVWSEGKTKKQIDSLQDYLAKLQTEIETHELALKNLARKSDDLSIFEFPDLDLDGDGSGQSDDGSSSIVVDINQYKSIQKQLLDVELAKVEAKAQLDAVRQRAAAIPDPRQWLQERVEQEFLALPEVNQVRDAMRALEVRLDEYRSRIRNPGDPALRELMAERQSLEDLYGRLWDEKMPQIRARLTQEEFNPEQVVRQAEQIVMALQTKEQTLRQQLDQLAVSNQERGKDAVEMQLVQTDLGQLQTMEAQVRRRLEQLEFERTGQNRITQVAEAKARQTPSTNKRTKYLAATPIAVLGLVLGLVTLVEMRAGRVSGTDDLSTRVPAEVFSVPPLPTVRSSDRRKLGSSAGHDQLERFVQQLDHVRVALCGEAGAVDGRGRCVLITSAVGGEGKTTLAAQLAVRCAEAGASTVLIDADLRRAMLGRLFEVPECPGLSDVLRGDAKLEDALVPISQVGGCQLLPAGSPEANPNRILQGKNFGPMLERLRHSFDVVIIDTSPVLPVPDALILGRYTDGAVLATRHDQSRFPAVERANHLLAGAGIPMLGVVVNGARPSGMHNNGYSYGYRPDRAPDAADRNPVSG